MWDSASGRELARVTHFARGVAFSPDGKRIATAGDGGAARVWDIASGRELARVTHEGQVNAVAFSPDGKLIATASGDRTARVWEIASGRELARVTYDGMVEGVAFSPDGTQIATACAVIDEVKTVERGLLGLMRERVRKQFRGYVVVWTVE